MNLAAQVLSDLTVYMKYARFLKDKQRRETWPEIVERNKQMHLRKYNEFPEIKEQIEKVYTEFVLTKKVLPSMRSMQFAGKPIEISPNRVFNCAYLPTDHWKSFSEVMFLLLGGTGVGYSVQRHHVDQLPFIIKPLKTRRYLIPDSIEGWADAVKMLTKGYFHAGATLPLFDFSDIRPKGAELITSGGKAPGPEPLKDCLHNLKKILDRKENGEQLTPLEVHDMICYIADAVLAGGIRRAALLSLFSFDDIEMRTCKYNHWYELNSQRGRANNSAVILRHRIKKKDFIDYWNVMKVSDSGEPGIYFSNDKDWGANPSLRGGTKVLTSNGIFPINDLQDKMFKVNNLEGTRANAKCRLSGFNKNLYEITLKSGFKYYATKEHEWPILNNDSYTKTKTIDIKPGDRLPVLKKDFLFNGKIGTREDGFFIGWHLGDGWTTKRKDTGDIQNGLVVGKNDVESKIDKILIKYLHENLKLKCSFSDRGSTLELNSVSKTWKALQDSFGYNYKTNGLPKRTWDTGSEDFRKGLLDGLFSSDGSVEKVTKRVLFFSSHKALIMDVSELLGFYGIRSTIRKRITTLKNYPNKEYIGYILGINDINSLFHFRKLVNLSHKDKNNRLLRYKLKPVKTLKRESIKIISVKKTDMKETVWDISVYDTTHCFQISQCVTGNCVEIGLRPNQFCNLTTINGSTVETQQDLNERTKAAAFIGTLQAGYTNFHYLREVWKKTTEKDSLLGVSITGVANENLLKCDLEEAAKEAIKENKELSEIIGIRKAARITCIKPEGTASLVLGTSSGIHAWHNEFYIRRLRIGKNEAIYSYLKNKFPELVEDDVFKPSIQAVLSIPQKAPDGAITRNEDITELMGRVKRFNTEWVQAGHIHGANSHNVSATLSVKEKDWDTVEQWLWTNKETYNGISIIPFAGGNHPQTPFEDISKYMYEKLMTSIKEIHLSKIKEITDNTQLKEELACAGGSCEIT